MTRLLDLDLQPTPSDSGTRAPASLLIVAAEPIASEVAAHLRGMLPAQVDVVADWSQCRQALQGKSYTLVLLEGSLPLTDPESVDALYASMTDGWILEVDYGVSDTERILRQVRAALHRRSRNEAHTQAAVLQSLRSQLTSCLTGLLLEAQLAVRQRESGAFPPLHRILDLAERLSELLRQGGA